MSFPQRETFSSPLTQARHVLQLIPNYGCLVQITHREPLTQYLCAGHPIVDLTIKISQARINAEENNTLVLGYLLLKG
jgi:hypothetical protein